MSQRAIQLRQAFDRGFAELPAAPARDTIDLLAVSLAGSPYAIQLQAVAGLHADKKITRIPVRAPGLLGIAGFRGSILPVYDLAALIGLPPASSPHWLAIVAHADIAIAFESFDGHLRVAREAIVSNDSREGGRRHLSHLLRTGDALRGVIHLDSALGSVLGRADS